MPSSALAQVLHNDVVKNMPLARLRLYNDETLVCRDFGKRFCTAKKVDERTYKWFGVGNPTDFMTLVRLPIVDLSPLAFVTAVCLDACNDVSDVSPISSCSTVALKHCRKVVDVSPLHRVTNLLIYGCPVTDVSALSAVFILMIRDCPVTDVSMLGSVHKLTLQCCDRITDVSGLSDVSGLKLWGCRNVVDVSGLRGAQRVRLQCCDGITDISALQDVPRLKVRCCYQVPDVWRTHNQWKTPPPLRPAFYKKIILLEFRTEPGDWYGRALFKSELPDLNDAEFLLVRSLDFAHFQDYEGTCRRVDILLDCLSGMSAEDVSTKHHKKAQAVEKWRAELGRDGISCTMLQHKRERVAAHDTSTVASEMEMNEPDAVVVRVYEEPRAGLWK